MSNPEHPAPRLSPDLQADPGAGAVARRGAGDALRDMSHQRRDRTVQVLLSRLDEHAPLWSGGGPLDDQTPRRATGPPCRGPRALALCHLNEGERARHAARRLADRADERGQTLPDARRALAELRALGIEASILSGDTAAAVAQTARQTGLTGQSAALPAEKQAAITRLQTAGRRVLMVGDGINDGPALAAADASIAPGSASDVGRQAADFVFTGDSLLALPRAVRAARATMRVVRENFAAAILYNACAVPLAMAGMITPLLAATAMATSSLIVVGNSLRLVRATR